MKVLLGIERENAKKKFIKIENCKDFWEAGCCLSFRLSKQSSLNVSKIRALLCLRHITL